MAEKHIHRNLADKRKQIQAYIGSPERDLEQARRDLSAIVATERVFLQKPKGDFVSFNQKPRRN